MSEINVRDMRRSGFAWLGNSDMRALRAAFEGRERASALALYTTMVEAANAARADSFEASRKRLADGAGMSPRSVDTYAERLVEIGLLRIVEQPGMPNEWVLTSAPDPRNAEHSPLATPCTGPSQRETPPSLKGQEGRNEEPPKPPRGNRVLSPAEEPEGFAQWLGQHAAITGQSVPRASTKARTGLARKFETLQKEGATLDEFRLASLGAHSDDFRRGKYDFPVNVLVFEKFDRLVELGRRAEALGPVEDKWAGVPE